ncbi:phosphotransferase-like protein [Actinacidiphila paucisporea]|uniref:Guanylate kinase n=1 Tax=Actinacidiphila paucisporea TaxID=310782 RepID=A0A1M7QSP6_9ACTN|nr:guanylate kinase [Actinacidiphila paucisporea]SHN34699.1 guanylate kinase [Actinacidiphila paucisporea]
MNGQQGVILYGPPAAGKDTVTRELVALAPRYRQFARLKVGAGKTTGYRMGTPEQLHGLEAVGDVVYTNSRYGNTYVIDRPGLDESFAAGVPVVHLGQVDGIRALVDGYPAAWVRVLLWCPKDVTEQRSQGRGDADTAQRLAAWDATRQDVDAHPDMHWDLRVETAQTSPAAAARLIDEGLRAGAGAGAA